MTRSLDPLGARVGRRDALKIGGLTVSLAALVAACGDDSTEAADPGRVGYLPPVTEPPEYAVTTAVLLRTISSVENTAAYAYDELLATGELEADLTEVVQRLADDHRAVAEEMAALTVAAGGQAWECTNPWMMDRGIDPILAAIDASDDPARDVVNTAIALENLTAATNQQISVQISDADASAAALRAAVAESRHSAAIVALVRGFEGYVSPSINGGDPPSDDDGIPLQFSIAHRFGSIGQIELVVGEPNENGVRESFALQTPSLNSYIYEELEPTC